MGLVQNIYNNRNRYKQALMGRRVVFHHVPKCAGTSVSRALRLRYFLSEESIAAPGTAVVIASQYGEQNFSKLEDFNRIRRFRVELLHYLMWKDVFFIGGHVPFNHTAYQQFRGYNLITVLRDPVERYISEYFYNYQRNHQSKIDMDFADYIESPLGQRNAMKFCEYFCGTTELTIDNPGNLVKQAKDHLEKFSVIGFTENMPQFESDVRSALGVRVSFGVQNKRTTSDKAVSDIVTPELKQRVTEMCRFDQEIYEFAKTIRTRLKSK